VRRYLVIGQQGTGKSTFGEALADAIGSYAADTSAWLYRVETARNGGKRPTRADLVALGNAVCDDDPAFLVARAFETGARVCCGVRRRVELDAARDQWPDLVVIYLDRPAGPEVGDDNCEVTREDADLVLRPESVRDGKALARTLAGTRV